MKVKCWIGFHNYNVGAYSHSKDGGVTHAQKCECGKVLFRRVSQTPEQVSGEVPNDPPEMVRLKILEAAVKGRNRKLVGHKSF